MSNFFLPFIETLIIPFLEFSYTIIPNVGIGIIALTLLLKAAFFTVSKKQFVSMKKMQELQPKLKKIQDKFKGTPQLQTEMMNLYRKEKVNPLGGCLPMLIQMPFFFMLYFAMVSEPFKAFIGQETIYEGFFPLWIDNLSASDPIYLLPLLIGLSTYLTQKLSPTTPGASQTIQKQMTIIFPFIMTFICLKVPSGVLLFWATNQIATGLQQYIIQKDLNFSGGNHG